MTRTSDQRPDDHDTARAARRRRHRRVDAPATNAAADSSDDLPAGPSDGTPSAPAAAEARPRVDGPPEDGRDAWIRAQRPPHWD